ncbi:MAG: sulfurtransferase TusA family protein [Nitrospirae bacterium]|nr:sulfurtransferase TusA family protein [Nitrospirota bacterium]
MNSLLPGETLDLRGTRCPLNFVKTKIKIDEMANGELLEIMLDAGEPVKNVPQSITAEGHEVLGIEKLDDGNFMVLVKV